MTQTETLFLDLLKCGMLNIRLNNIQGDLNSIEFLAKTHICLPLVYQGAVNCKLSLEEDWKKSAMRIVLKNENNLRVQNAALERLKAANIPCAVIKGSSAAANYAQPFIRPLGDIDLLVRQCDYEKAIALFTPENESVKMQDHKFHYHFMMSGFRIEIHKHITEVEENAYGRKCEPFMFDALNKVDYASYEGYCFPVLVKKYQAAVLLLHMQRHFLENKFVMRMLCDWAMFVSSVSKRNWEEEIVPMAETVGLRKFADALTQLCDLYLGTNNQEKIFYRFEARFYENLMEDLLSGGIIVSGRQTSRNIGNFYSQNSLKTKSKVLAVIYSLNEISRQNFTMAKHKFLLPFFWCYLPVRYLFKQAIGKRGILSLHSFADSARHKKEIYQKLDLHE